MVQIPLIESVPALAVIEPRATIDVLAVIVEVLAMPFTINVPSLRVLEH